MQSVKAKDVTAVCRALEGPMHLLGHSFGALCCLRCVRVQGSESPSNLRIATRLVNAAMPDSRIVVLLGHACAAITTAPEPFAGEAPRFLMA